MPVPCSSRVTTPAASTSILQSLWEKVSNSPPDLLLLPVYARGIAEDFVKAPRRAGRSRKFRGDQRVLKFVDDVAHCDSDVDCE